MEVVLLPVGILAAAVLAVVVTLWLYATYEMLRPIVAFLANLVSGVPFVGDKIAGAVNDLESDVQSWIQTQVQNAYDAASQPIVDLMTNYGVGHAGSMYSERLVLQGLVFAVTIATEQALNRVNSPTQTTINETAAANNTYITNNYQADLTQSYSYTEASYGQLADWANNAIQSVYNDVVAADGRVSTLATSVSADLQQTRDYAASVAATAEANAVNLAGDYTKESFLTGEDYTTKVRDYATAINADTRTWAEGEITSRTNDVANALDSKIAIVATVAAATETAFADFMNNCGDPLCSGLTNLAKAFNSTKDLLGTALLLGFIEEAVRNPEPTADATVAVADVILDPAKAIIADIFGG